MDRGLVGGAGRGNPPVRTAGGGALVRALCAGLTAIVLLVGQPASADEGKRTWYGGWLLASDVVSDALVLAPSPGAIARGDAAGAVGIVGLVGAGVGAPLVHAGFGRPAQGLGSFGLRLLAFGAGVLLHGVLGSECWKDDGAACGRWNRLAYLAPLVVVQGYDAAVLGWRPAHEP